MQDVAKEEEYNMFVKRSVMNRLMYPKISSMASVAFPFGQEYVKERCCWLAEALSHVIFSGRQRNQTILLGHNAPKMAGIQ